MTDFRAPLRTLAGAGVEFILVGGVASVAHGFVPFDSGRGRRIRCLGLKKLIDVKRAAGRPKDLEALAELEALDEETRGGTNTY